MAGDFLRHEECPDCKGSDCLAVYDDGGAYCFGKCQEAKKSTGTSENTERVKPKNKDLVQDIVYRALTKRKISKKTCEIYGYGWGAFKMGDEKGTMQVARYFDAKGMEVAQKIRSKDKDFRFIGDTKKALLFGQHRFRNKGGKKIVITEGEIDCLSVAEAFDCRYPVVSIPTGAGGARKELQAQIEFLESYEQIVLWFDSDEPGIKAVEECNSLFSPGKLYIVATDPDNKDASDVLKNLGAKEVQSRVYDAKEHREDGIVDGDEIEFDMLSEPIKIGAPFPYPKLQDMTMGAREGELFIWTAGSGIGKTTIVTEVAKNIIDTTSDKVGLLYLEENLKKTASRFIALENNVPIKDFRLDPSIISDEARYKAYEKYFKSNRLALYNHFGSVDTGNLMAKIRYLNKVKGCSTVILDHISIAISGIADTDERKTLDMFMTNLRSFCEETGCIVHAIVHLKRTSGKKSFNEGGTVSLTDLRGSGALEQLSDAVIAVERDQQSEDPCMEVIRILKCRETGETGLADTLWYNKETGRLELYTGQESEGDFDDDKEF